jgi:hypothetical protein
MGAGPLSNTLLVGAWGAQGNAALASVTATLTGIRPSTKSAPASPAAPSSPLPQRAGGESLGERGNGGPHRASSVLLDGTTIPSAASSIKASCAA